MIPSFAQQQVLNFISEINGKVEILRAGRNNYQPAYPGDFLNPTDKLRLEQGASVKVICNNLSIWNLKTRGEFEIHKGCQSTNRIILIRQGSNTSDTRAGNNSKIPYLINPRNTAILNQQPTLSWNPVKSVTGYRVQISGGELDWTTNVNQPMVVYSGKQPLRSGVFYEVVITASNGVSTKDIDDPTFFVLSDSDIHQIKTDITKLQQQSLNNESKTITLAHLYRSQDLNADAIDVLEKLVKSGTKITSVYQLLGNIYQHIGLNLLAREKYLIGLKLAQGENNLEAQAGIQVRLGEVDETLNQPQQALQSYQAAIANYQVLGDEEQVRRLKQKLDKFQQ
ncbi:MULTISPECIES: lipopolysaccharide assembly protein LapB [Nostocaceae]|uniref:tetratricopeptide repeat protein n=1 Tax=Nostocaceae TaxID=1162 RepID=UPI00168B5DCD|nr:MULTISPECIES: tetratricopeptide repeat protein [Nostocaceae]MBD2479897.1 tetratricopeptide repeat protein [Anabaena sp. FACHB-83]